MGKRGRLSNDANIVAIPSARGSRPEPPATLNPAEAAVWLGWVSKMPPDFFRPEDLETLEKICITKVEIRDLKEQMREHRERDLLGGFDVKTYNTLRKERREHLRLYLLLLRSLRLTKQSLDRKTETRKRLRDPGAGLLPWEDDTAKSTD